MAIGKKPQKMNNSTYVITGKLRNGKRFSPITTTIPQYYNIWEGSLWLLKDNKRKLIKRYY